MTAAPRPFRWKRFTLHLGAFVLCSALGGLVTAVAVAWGLAAWLPHRALASSYQLVGATRNGREDYSIPTLELNDYWRAGMSRRNWITLDYGAFYGPTPLSWDYEQRPFTKLKREPDQTWGRLPASIAREPGAPTHGLEDARGWPCLALWCQLDYHRPLATAPWVSTTGGIPISNRFVRIGDFRALPYRPIYRGLLLDTAAYAPAWAVLLALVRFRPLRRALRRRRHQCPACGYDLRGLAPATPCPECGPRA